MSVVALAGCGSEPPVSPDGGGGGGSDAGPMAVDAWTPPFPTHDCAEADYVDRTAGADDVRVIGVATDTLAYDVPCMIVRAGQSVTFASDFTMHPLGSGVAPGHGGTGTEPSPIEPQTTGTSYVVTFPSAGDYPFYCTSHFHSSGMYGVVRVVP